MAKNYLTYDEYLEKARKQAAEQQSDYAAARYRNAESAVQNLKTQEMAARGQIVADTQDRIRETKAAYQSLYDENAVREKVAQLNVEETLANMGLTDSGLNRTQQTALAATRARADAAVNLKKQQAVDTLLNEMTAAIEKNRAAIAAEQTKEWAAMTEDIETNRATLEKEAQAAATAQFGADLKAADQAFEQEMQSRKFAQDVKEWQAEAERQNAKIQADIALQQQKQSDSVALQKQKQSDSVALEQLKQTISATLQQQKQSDSVALQKQKQSDSVALQKQKQSDSVALEKLKQTNSAALQKQKQSDSVALEKLKQTNSAALQKQKQGDSVALEKLKQTNSAALQQQKQSDSAALQQQKQKATLGDGKTLTASQRAELAESLRKAISDRTNVYNESLRKHYDDLIAYYEAQLY